MYDPRLLMAHTRVRQYLYNRIPFDRDLQGTDFTNAFVNLKFRRELRHSYLLRAHDLSKFHEEYFPRVSFYVASILDKMAHHLPRKTSKHYIELIKICFAPPQTPIKGWFVTNLFDREITPKSFLPTVNGPLIQIKDITKVHVLVETRNQYALVRKDTPTLVETNTQSLPIIALCLDSRKSKTGDILFFDVNLNEPRPAEALQRAHVTKSPSPVNSKLRMDVSIKTLRSFYEEAKASNPKITRDFDPTDRQPPSTSLVEPDLWRPTRYGECQHGQRLFPSSGHPQLPLST